MGGSSSCENAKLLQKETVEKTQSSENEVPLDKENEGLRDPKYIDIQNDEEDGALSGQTDDGQEHIDENLKWNKYGFLQTK